MGGDRDGLRNLDTGKSCTFEEAQAELRDPRAVTTLTPRALSDDKRKTTVTRLSQKALKLANTAVAADTKGNVKAALADYKSVNFNFLADFKTIYRVKTQLNQTTACGYIARPALWCKMTSFCFI